MIAIWTITGIVAFGLFVYFWDRWFRGTPVDERTEREIHDFTKRNIERRHAPEYGGRITEE